MGFGEGEGEDLACSLNEASSYSASAVEKGASLRFFCEEAVVAVEAWVSAAGEREAEHELQ